MDERIIAVDLYNQVLTGGVCMTLRQKAADSDHIPCVLILNDQGGGVMNISKDITATLRAQDHGHPP